MKKIIKIIYKREEINKQNKKKSCLDWFLNQKPVGIYFFFCEVWQSTVTGLTSQLHSVLSNHIHSYSTGSRGFTEKTATAPEERKPRVTAIPHAHKTRHCDQVFSNPTELGTKETRSSGLFKDVRIITMTVNCFCYIPLFCNPTCP